MIGSSSNSSTAPVQRECACPGKTLWTIGPFGEFELDQQYVPLRAIGKGGSGVVCSATNMLTGEKVAIKKIANAFEKTVEALRTLREITLLRLLKHENIIALKDIMRPPSKEKGRYVDMYLVYELMDTDLHHLLTKSQMASQLTIEHFQYLIWQILKGLQYIHSANVLHRDIKPSNLLVNGQCQLKICDFGLARTSTERNFMTEYVVTRWYRAPELLLSCEHYTSAIDVWSVGCILAEMLGRKPLFPGKDYLEQMQCVLQVLGLPSDHDMGFMTNRNVDDVKTYLQRLSPPQRTSLRAMFAGADPLAVDLMERMLTFDPRKRITVDEALCHPWLRELSSDDEQPCKPVPFSLDFEDQQISERSIRERVWSEVVHYHPTFAEQSTTQQPCSAPQWPLQPAFQPFMQFPAQYVRGAQVLPTQALHQQPYQPSAQYVQQPPMQQPVHAYNLHHGYYDVVQPASHSSIEQLPHQQVHMLPVWQQHEPQIQSRAAHAANAAAPASLNGMHR